MAVITNFEVRWDKAMYDFVFGIGKSQQIIDAITELNLELAQFDVNLIDMDALFSSREIQIIKQAPFGGEQYNDGEFSSPIFEGQTTSTAGKRLIDNTAAFVASDQYENYFVKNASTGQFSTVKSVKSATEIELWIDIFQDGGANEDYEIWRHITLLDGDFEIQTGQADKTSNALRAFIGQRIVAALGLFYEVSTNISSFVGGDTAQLIVAGNETAFPITGDGEFSQVAQVSATPLASLEAYRILVSTIKVVEFDQPTGIVLRASSADVFISEEFANRVSFYQHSNPYSVTQIATTGNAKRIATQTAFSTNPKVYSSLSNDKVAVIDAANALVEVDVSVGGTVGPDTIDVNNFVDRAYILFGSLHIGWIDPITNAYTKEAPLFGGFPADLSWDGNTTSYWIALSNGTATRFNIFLPGAVQATVAVGANPQHLRVIDFVQRCYVCNTGTNTVSVINTSTDTVINTLIVASGPSDTALDPFSGILYIMCSTGAAIYAVNVFSGNIIFVISGVFSGALGGIEFNDNDGYLYVSEASGNVAIVDPFDAGIGWIRTEVRVPAGPASMVRDPERNFYHVLCPVDNEMALIGEDYDMFGVYGDTNTQFSIEDISVKQELNPGQLDINDMLKSKSGNLIQKMFEQLGIKLFGVDYLTPNTINEPSFNAIGSWIVGGAWNIAAGQANNFGGGGNLDQNNVFQLFNLGQTYSYDVTVEVLTSNAGALTIYGGTILLGTIPAGQTGTFVINGAPDGSLLRITAGLFNGSIGSIFARIVF